jgi:thiosulfate/3-mercaptopyruvate sulfurtransferase
MKGTCRWLPATAVMAMFCIPGAGKAQPACGGHGDRGSMVISSSWLAQHLADPNLVILAVGQKSEYDAGHIPGSQFLDYMSTHTMPKSKDELSVELPPMPELAKVFEGLGVSNDSRIILYWLKGWTTQTARVYLTLDAMGLGGRVAILDGGLPAWSASQKVSTEAPSVQPGKLKLCPQNDIIADLDYVKANLKHPGVAIVDARNPEYYTGEKMPNQPRAGHIPGATNITFSTVFDEHGLFKPVDALQQRYRDAGIKPDDRVVSYCHIGQQASLIYFVSRYLGYDARMYDGSWDEWSRHPELPTEMGTAQR